MANAEPMAYERAGSSSIWIEREEKKEVSRGTAEAQEQTLLSRRAHKKILIKCTHRLAKEFQQETRTNTTDFIILWLVMLSAYKPGQN